MKYSIIDGPYQSQTQCRKIGLAVAVPQQQGCLCGCRTCATQRCTHTAQVEVGSVSQALRWLFFAMETIVNCRLYSRLQCLKVFTTLCTE